MWCKNAVLQFGRLGWRSAHDRLEMEGCAGPVTGEIDFSDTGKVLGSLGCRIGDTNALQSWSVKDGLSKTERKDQNLRPAQTRDRCERVHNLFFLWPGDIAGQRLRSAGDVARRELQDNTAEPLGKIRTRAVENARERLTLGVVSRSKTKAWKSWAHETGMSSQLPNHHGRLSSHPLESMTLKRNSRLRVLQ